MAKSALYPSRLFMKLMASRFHELNQPSLDLNKDQLLAIDKFKQNIADGKYNFESVSCLCGQKSDDSILLSSTDRYGLEVPTHLCPKCGLIWTSKRLDENSLKLFYQNDYRNIYVGESQASEIFFNNQVEQGKRIFDFVKDYLKSDQVENPIVFEIGCGSGGILIPFKLAGCSVYGCDLGGVYLEKGREKGLTLEDGDVNALEKYGKADLVILSHVLEHFPDPVSTLRNISGILKDDGFVYIEVPGVYKIHETYGDFMLFLQNAHLYHFTLNRLIILMSKLNFQLIKGDQYIKSLFQKEDDLPMFSVDENHWQVLTYIYFTEFERHIRLRRSLSRIRMQIMANVRRFLGNEFVDAIKSRIHIVKNSTK